MSIMLFEFRLRDFFVLQTLNFSEILVSFRFGYEYEIEYEYDFRISNQ